MVALGPLRVNPLRYNPRFCTVRCNLSLATQVYAGRTPVQPDLSGCDDSDPYQDAHTGTGGGNEKSKGTVNPSRVNLVRRCRCI